ncbi:hypothetical protein [Methylobacterium sp. CM6247]
MGKRGPVSKGEYVGQTAVLSTRITPDLRAMLEAEVVKSGKTLSREIEHRLRRSFIEDDKISEAFGSRRNYAFMRLISMVLELWHNPADPLADWKDDPFAYDQACSKVAGVLRAMRPAGESKALSELERVIAEVKSFDDPARIVQKIQSADNALPLGGSRRNQVLSLLKSDLGPVADRPQISEVRPSGSADNTTSNNSPAGGAKDSKPKRSRK